MLLQDRIVSLCDPHGECVVGTGAATIEEVLELCLEIARPRPVTISGVYPAISVSTQERAAS